MTARILDGRKIASAVRRDLTREAEVARERLGQSAGLAIARVGNDAASAVYTQALMRASEAIGVTRLVAGEQRRRGAASGAAQPQRR